MNSIWIGVLVVISVLGLIIPFVDSLVVIEMFYLAIPFGILFFSSLIFVIVSLFIKSLRSNRTFFLVWVVPMLITSQFISAYVVDKIQRYRSELIIDEIESAVLATGKFPADYDAPIGIELQHIDSEATFKISYSSGFLVTEVYESRLKSWKSHGWND